MTRWAVGRFCPSRLDGMFRVGTMPKPVGDGGGANRPFGRMPVEVPRPQITPGGGRVLSRVRVIDRDRLDELRELEADSAPGLVAALFNSFLTGVEADLDSLARAAERGDATVLCDVCHRLKGAALTLGADAASEACAALESAAAAGQAGLYPALLERLRLECARVAADVDGWGRQ